MEPISKQAMESVRSVFSGAREEEGQRGGFFIEFGCAWGATKEEAWIRAAEKLAPILAARAAIADLTEKHAACEKQCAELMADNQQDMKSDEELVRLRARVQELDDALLYVADGEEDSSVTYQNCVEGGKKRRAESERIDEAIRDARPK